MQYVYYTKSQEDILDESKARDFAIFIYNYRHLIFDRLEYTLSRISKKTPKINKLLRNRM